MSTKERQCPIDGLPAMEAQEWAEEKHKCLRQYLDISKGARGKFLRAGGATYTELFSGPGRLFQKGTDRFFDGSPLVAFREAQRTRTPFTTMHMGDAEPRYCDAVEKRLTGLGASVRPHRLKSEAAATAIVRELRDDALNVAFLDPFNLGDIPFTIIETFAPLKRIDLLVHFSAMDLMRQLPGMIKDGSGTLDRFAPGWQEAVRGLQAGTEARGKIIEHWLGLVRAAGFKSSKVWKLIKGPNNQPLYWLLLVAKHELATQFWDEVSKSKQGGFDF